MSLMPANQPGIHTRRSSSPQVCVHRALLIEPAEKVSPHGPGIVFTER